MNEWMDGWNVLYVGTETAPLFIPLGNLKDSTWQFRHMLGPPHGVELFERRFLRSRVETRGATVVREAARQLHVVAQA